MSTIDSLQRAFSAQQFDPYITSIRFPHFKNLEPNFEIEFTFPVTALIGPNGCNKSSILRALQSCPEGSSISDYWFDTALDQIDERTGSQRYIHTYRAPSGNIAEVMKQRVNKSERGDDYFETTRPRKRDKMRPMPPYDVRDEGLRNKERWKPIQMHALYLDFRAILPAYDIFMNFNWRRQDNTPQGKKHLVRLRSSRISSALEDSAASSKFAGVERLVHPARRLPKTEVEEIGRILGKCYSDVRIVEHDYYRCEGCTALMETSNLHYSEAFAGSGEFAVVKLVHEICSAHPRSLVLLDEPETSLHPGAQKELMGFLLGQALSHKHQIVMSTHSPSMVEDLPPAGRKVVAARPSDGRIYLVSHAATAREAFERIGATYSERKVLVEDDLAAEVVRRALRGKGPDYLKTVDVNPIPGGSGTILNRIIPDLATLNSPAIVLLDGDQAPADRVNPKNVSDSELEKELEKYQIFKKNLPRNGGSGVTDGEIAAIMRTTLTWMWEHVGYLPGSFCPESLVIEMEGGTGIEDAEEAKGHWVERARMSLGLTEGEEVGSSGILGEQQRALAKVEEENPLLMQLREEIERLFGND